jgi:hypothetical protein
MRASERERQSKRGDTDRRARTHGGKEGGIAREGKRKDLRDNTHPERERDVGEGTVALSSISLV